MKITLKLTGLIDCFYIANVVNRNFRTNTQVMPWKLLTLPFFIYVVFLFRSSGFGYFPPYPKYCRFVQSDLYSNDTRQGAAGILRTTVHLWEAAYFGRWTGEKALAMQSMVRVIFYCCWSDWKQPQEFQHTCFRPAKLIQRDFDSFEIYIFVLFSSKSPQVEQEMSSTCIYHWRCSHTTQ